MPHSHLVEVEQHTVEAAYARGGSFVQGGLPVRRTADEAALPATQPPPYQAASARAMGDFADEHGSAVREPPRVALRRVSTTAPAYDMAAAPVYRRASVQEVPRASAEPVPDRRWEQPQRIHVGAQQMARAGRDSMTAPLADQSPPSFEQGWPGENQNVAVVTEQQRRQSASQQQLPASRRGSVAAFQQEPQMRVSRLSLGGPAQEEPIQLDGAFLPPLSARTSFVSERRASAPVNALPHIPEEPPVPPTTGATPGMVFSKVLAPELPLRSTALCITDCNSRVHHGHMSQTTARASFWTLDCIAMLAGLEPA